MKVRQGFEQPQGIAGYDLLLKQGAAEQVRTSPEMSDSRTPDLQTRQHRRAETVFNPDDTIH